MKWLSKKSAFVIMLAPTLLIFTAYIIIPIGVAMYYSFTSFTGIGKPSFVGLSNYKTLFGDKIFYLSLKNTGIVLLISAITVIPLSFLLALLLNRAFPGTKAVRALNFSPNIIAPILVGLIWVFILDPSMGLLNAVFRQFGLEQFQPEWIGGEPSLPILWHLYIFGRCWGIMQPYLSRLLRPFLMTFMRRQALMEQGD